MKKYKVEMIRTEKFIVDVLAKDEAEAKSKASENFRVSGHYVEVDEAETSIGTVYDVTNTDDPFNPADDSGKDGVCVACKGKNPEGCTYC